MIRQYRVDPIAWPEKRDLFGLGISLTTYRGIVRLVLEAARRREPAVVSFHPVDAVVRTSATPELLEKVNRFQVVAPDGQPVRWAINWLHAAGLPDRVCGPDSMFALCRRAAKTGIPVFFFGSSPEVLADLRANMSSRIPSLRVAGAISPPFRPLTPAEDDEIVAEINASGAGIVFIGLGYPKQDLFADAHRDRIRAVQVCVGAAFDFHSGRTPRAPRWMRRSGLEWCHRLVLEPRRMWRRYCVNNTIFVTRLCLALAKKVASGKWPMSSGAPRLPLPTCDSPIPTPHSPEE